MSLSVDVISDVICPWCYIGKRRLEKAIDAAEVQASVRWHPFLLNPTMQGSVERNIAPESLEVGNDQWNWMLKSSLSVN